MEGTLDSYNRFLSGDQEALAGIIRDYKDGLILYLNGYVNDLITAEELTEDTFVKLVVKRPHFSQRSSFKTWLYTIGRNTALDHLRQNRGREVPLEECPPIRDEEQDLERAYIRQEEKRLLYECMRKLKKEYQQALWLAYFEGFTYRQISRILRKTPHNVETLVYRARLALKTKLLEEGFVYEDI